MLKKRYRIIGVIEVGDQHRILLYQDDIVKRKKLFSLTDIAASGDVSEMQNKALQDSIIANNPPLLYLSNIEFYASGLNIGDILEVTIIKEGKNDK